MDYEKKYKEALEKAKEYWETDDDNTLDIKVRRTMEYLFPELKESEDERIRKNIIAIFKGQIPYTSREDAEKYIAWLEKQGDKLQKTSIWKHWKDGIAGNGEGEPIYLVKNGNTYSLNSCLGYECDYIELSELDKLMLEKQGEHNSNYIHITQTIIDYINKNKEKFENDIPKLGDIWNVREICTYPGVNNGKPVVEIENGKGAWMRLPLHVVYFVQGGSPILSNSSGVRKNEQKLTWSEEDEKRLQSCLNILQAKGIMGVTETINSKWLKSLKERVFSQPKQEWSEEDERILNGLISSLVRIGANTRTDSTSLNYTFPREINWLKSLKQRIGG